MSKVLYYFKLFNNIKADHEAEELAKMEIEGLIGQPKAVHNVVDLIMKTPFSAFTGPPVRIQDILTHELPYGKIQGYYLVKEDLEDIIRLVSRLAYTREIFVLVQTGKPDEVLTKLFPQAKSGKNAQYFTSGNYSLFRFITHQYFLEKSQYISKLSRNEQEVDRNVEILFSHLTDCVYRVPASSTLNVGKRLQDYFAIREEPSLYLTHYMHPYKGKFHPKMVRAILNYVYPKAKGQILDNFAGSGTLLVEANFVGLDSIGIEINPLSVLMTNVKCRCLNLEPPALRSAIDWYLQQIYEKSRSGQQSLYSLDFESVDFREQKSRIPPHIVSAFRDKTIIDRLLLARNILYEVEDINIRDFLLLALSGTISDLYRRTTGTAFGDALKVRLNDLYLRVYLFHRLNTVLNIPLGKGWAYVGDARSMDVIEDTEINGIINSPPYSTALDYIKNDEPQLYILDMVRSMSELQSKMMGNPRAVYDRKALLSYVVDDVSNIKGFSPYGFKTINMLLESRRTDAALRTYKFWDDLFLATKEMNRVLKPKAKCAVIIGNNHYSLDGKYIEVQNDRAFLEMAQKAGLSVDRTVKRNLEKSSKGNIRYESIVILQKH